MLQDKSTSTTNNNLYLWLLLAMTPKIGPVTALKLIHHFGSIENVYAQNHNTLAQVINKSVAKLITDQVSSDAAKQALAWVKLDPRNHIISIADPLYPKELAQISDPPLILYLKGNTTLLKNNKFAIVGTRHPTEQGSLNALRFARDLANNGLTIVSGMALGIDKSAHTGALEGTNSTIGVIGTGIDLIYPASNRDLFEQILARGGLIISEFPLNTQPLVSNFPRRNRIIAGLSLGLLVVESAMDGGSMISANLALEMGREVMAIPGSIHNPVARGCHKLIKTGAKLVETSNDILEDLRLDISSMAYNPTLEDNPILQCMGYEAVTIDQIGIHLKLEFAELCASLLDLELSGKIVNCGSGRYQRVFT